MQISQPVRRIPRIVASILVVLLVGVVVATRANAIGCSEDELVTAILDANGGGSSTIDLTADCVYSFSDPYSADDSFDFWYGRAPSRP